MSFGGGHLTNSLGDIAVDSTILVAVFAAYYPQVVRIWKHGETKSISPFYILFNAFFSTTLLADTLSWSAYIYPNSSDTLLKMVGEGRLRGFAAFGALLGLLQVTAQWLCSMTLVALFAANPRDKRSSPESCTRFSGIFITILTLVHAMIFLAPIAAICLPQPQRDDMGISILWGFSRMANLLMRPICFLIQFYSQYREVRRMPHSSEALSIQSLRSAAIVLPLVALRGLMKLDVLSLLTKTGILGSEDFSLLGLAWHLMVFVWGEVNICLLCQSMGNAGLLAVYRHARGKGKGEVFLA